MWESLVDYCYCYGVCALTFPQHHPLIGRELGLNWLG